LPTDTVFGLAVDPSKPAAVERLFRLKRRPVERRLPVMVAEMDQLGALGVEISEAAEKLLKSQYVPGPLTIAVGFKPGHRVVWLRSRDELAIRIPDDDTLLSVLRITGPLYVTSANAHGSPTPDEISAVLSQLDGNPDLVVEGRPGGGKPSTLVNCRLRPPVIERAGAVSEREIRELLG
jgi:L-threonylcarbamoyladenylate synthase